MVSRPALTTTSYAILGLLALRPWTTYELAQQMQRTLNRFWPRARSKLYEEPKKLAAHGLAHAEVEKVGNRPRTVYSITPAGREALRTWLHTPNAAPMALESEHLVKLFFAEGGTTGDALRTLGTLRDWADEQLDVFAAASKDYLAGGGEFRDRAAVHMLTSRFMVDFYAMVSGWADWAAEVTRSYPDDPAAAEPDWSVLAETLRRAEQASEGR